MTRSAHTVVPAVLTVLLIACAAPAVEIESKDGAWRVTAETYRAVVSPEGHFRSLVVDGVEFLKAGKRKKEEYVGGDFPGDAPAAKVAREDDAVVATRDEVTVRYEFDDEGFTVRSEGGAVRWMLSDDVTACVSTDGVSKPGGARGDVFRIVAGEAAVAVDKPHHVTWGLAFPSRLTRGGKPAELFTARWTCGVDVSPAELIDLAGVKPTGRDARKTAEYEPGETPKMTVELASLAGAPADLVVGWTVHDHPHDGRQVAGAAESVRVESGGTKELHLDIPVEKPGLYWLRVSLLDVADQTAPGEGKGRPLQSRTRGFICDADNYTPPLTRPDDFEAFWDARLREMRKIPFEPELTPNDEYAIDGYKGFDLEINGQDGERLACVLVVPDSPGPHDAEIGGSPGSPEKVRRMLTKYSKQPAGAGMWERGAPRIRVGADLPEKSTYRSWNGRDDNNMLHSYLRMVRLADYLRSRDDVRRIWLFGASRTGASMLAAGALAPEKVAAVNVHVPTCCGISWSERPYRGWGRPPSRNKEGLKTAAYFDPVNFAPDMEVPVVMDGGFYDGLAPAPGILAFRNHAVNAPFRRCAIEQGQHGYFKFSRRKQMEADLAEHLEQTDD